MSLHKGLNCLSAFVSLSTYKVLLGVPVEVLYVSQLPFGFCLTFDSQLEPQTEPPVLGSQLPFGFCLTFDGSDVVRNCVIKPRESQLPFGFCLTFDGKRRKSSLESALRSLNCLSASASLSTPSPSRPSRASSARTKSQLPFGFCLTFDRSASGLVACGPTQMSQLPFGFCLTFDFNVGLLRYFPGTLDPVSIAFRLLPHFRQEPALLPDRHPCRRGLNCLSASASLSTRE